MSHLLSRRFATVLLLAATATWTSDAQEISFAERYALADDRQAALTELVPGTEDYYFYRCLDAQHRQQFDRASELLALWAVKHQSTPRLQMMRHRQALLSYGESPRATLQHLAKHLNLRFDHQRARLGDKPDLPTVLDPDAIHRDKFASQAFLEPKLEGFQRSAFPWLAKRQLTAVHRRALLQRQNRPELPNLVELIDADLREKNSGGFGSLRIHLALVREQLDALAKRQPQLRNHEAFVDAYLKRLKPGGDDDWRNDDAVQSNYLKSLRQFTGDLGSTYNSLKAHVLYHQLDFERSRGKRDKQMFLEYLRLPRVAAYVNPLYLQRDEHRRVQADLGKSFPSTLLPPVTDDTPLVRDYFLHIFKTEDTYDEYLPLVRSEFLKAVFAEAKIVNGLGNPEQWASLLSPSAFQGLRDRVDLDFDPRNKKRFARNDAVTLDVHIKNVEKLIVKVFQINARNYYQNTGRQVGPDIELDGLVPNWSREFHYAETPFRRVTRHFEFSELSQPGVYVVDFIGNGQSSRAIIRKGQMRVLTRPSALGQLLTVVDEDRRHAKDAAVWYAGTVYQPNDKGVVVLPYSTATSTDRDIVIVRGDEAYLTRIRTLQETYELDVDFYVDHESLLSRQDSTVLIRPTLTLSGRRISLSELSDVTLTIASVDLDGIPSSTRVKDFSLAKDRESTHPFQVPPRVKSITFTLSGQVKVTSRGNETTTLSSSRTFSLNEVLTSQQVADLHLSHTTDGYAIHLLGRSGEALPDRAVTIGFRHRDFVAPLPIALRTDQSGAIKLGGLDEIAELNAQSAGLENRVWHLQHDRAARPKMIHAAAGEDIVLPLLPHERDEIISLLEIRDAQYVRDAGRHVAPSDGLLTISDLPAGDYELSFQHNNRTVAIRVSQGPLLRGTVLGEARHLETTPTLPAISRVALDDGQIHIQIANPSRYTRVHVIATRFVPAFSAFEALRGPQRIPDATNLVRRGNLFAEGRRLSDEYQYILRRQSATKYPGNMLERPTLLLNPWALRSTDVALEELADGTKFAPETPPTAPVTKDVDGRHAGPTSQHSPTSLEFLADQAMLAENLVPDKEGEIVVPEKLLNPWQLVRVIAVDPRAVIQRTIPLPASPRQSLDLRLAESLDAEQPFVQKRAMNVVQRGDELRISRTEAGHVEIYDSLRRVYELYETLIHDPRLTEFRVLLDWPTFDREKKREVYSKLASHEMHLFLFHKDREFFDNEVRPYLKSKRDKRFVDRWLLDDDLAPFMSAWRHEQLNVVERILLGQRLGKQDRFAARHIEELLALKKPDLDRERFLFSTALNRSLLQDRQSNAKHLGRDTRRFLIDNSRNGDGGQPELAQEFSQGRPDDVRLEVERLKRQPSNREYLLGELGEERGDGESKSSRGKELSVNGVLALGDDPYFDQLGRTRQKNSPATLYRVLDKTKEWAENNYYHVPIEKQGPDLIPVNAFWNDYAKHVDNREQGDDSPFVSANFAEATSNFSECMLALAVLDLPFESSEHDSVVDEANLTIRLKSPAIVLLEQLEKAKRAEGDVPILVSQNLFRLADRYRYVENQRLDKYAQGDLRSLAVYGCQVVVTNPTSSPQELNVLLQIPTGAIAVGPDNKATRSEHIELGAFATKAIEYFFYFPAAGSFAHYPVQVSRNESVLASGDAKQLTVVDQLRTVDRWSWPYISQNGSDQQVLRYLRDANVQRLDLSKIAFRMKDQAFFKQVVQLLRQRHVYQHELWSYSIHHNLPNEAQEFLRNANQFVSHLGEAIDSPLLTVDPVERRTYQQLDYRPLVNARRHQLGANRRILNDRFHLQYHRLMDLLALQPKLMDRDRMAVVYYLLLQDRIAEALDQFAQVNPRNLETKIQHDYFRAYLAFCQSDVDRAEQIAARYADHPVKRWQKAFASIAEQVDEIQSGGPIRGQAEQTVESEIQPEDRNRQMTRSADASVSFDLKVENGEAILKYQNSKKATVNYYLMDLELLFSRNPFVQEFSGQFSHIHPNRSDPLKLKNYRGTHRWRLPEELNNSNVLIEVVAGGVTKSHAYYSNSLTVSIIDRFGQLRIRDVKSQPLSKVYVKVYAQHRDGSIRFHKDGYTDLRGRFDYASLSGDSASLDTVKKFSLLLLSNEHGAVVREAQPPAQ